MQLWGRRISQLGELADIKDENGEQLKRTSYWMRHTFVRWCLDNNISTENIAMLIAKRGYSGQALQHLD